MGYLWVGGMDNPISEMMLTKETKQLNGKIVECMWNPVKCQWVFMRVRDDKSFPNNWKTAEGAYTQLCDAYSCGVNGCINGQTDRQTDR